MIEIKTFVILLMCPVVSQNLGNTLQVLFSIVLIQREISPQCYIFTRGTHLPHSLCNQWAAPYPSIQDHSSFELYSENNLVFLCVWMFTHYKR